MKTCAHRTVSCRNDDHGVGGTGGRRAPSQRRVPRGVPAAPGRRRHLGASRAGGTEPRRHPTPRPLGCLAPDTPRCLPASRPGVHRRGAGTCSGARRRARGGRARVHRRLVAPPHRERPTRGGGDGAAPALRPATGRGTDPAPRPLPPRSGGLTRPLAHRGCPHGAGKRGGAGARRPGAAGPCPAASGALRRPAPRAVPESGPFRVAAGGSVVGRGVRSRRLAGRADPDPVAQEGWYRRVAAAPVAPGLRAGPVLRAGAGGDRGGRLGVARGPGPLPGGPGAPERPRQRRLAGTAVHLARPDGAAGRGHQRGPDRPAPPRDRRFGMGTCAHRMDPCRNGDHPGVRGSRTGGSRPPPGSAPPAGPPRPPRTAPGRRPHR